MLDHSFTLQAIMEVQKSISELSTKTERLIKDVESHGAKIDSIVSKVNFVRGATWVLGAICAAGLAVGMMVLKASLPKLN